LENETVTTTYDDVNVLTSDQIHKLLAEKHAAIGAEVSAKISTALWHATSNDDAIRSEFFSLAHRQAEIVSDLRKQFADLAGRVQTLETPKTYTTAELPSNGTTVVWNGNKQKWFVRIIRDGWYYNAMTCCSTQSEACERA